MATSSTSFCDICESRGTRKTAIIWCSECDELLCHECTEHHSISKSSKNHTTQSVDDYKNLPSFILTATDKCNVHSGKYEFFCPAHDDLCCVQCLHDKHKDCDQLFPLSAVIHNVKTSAFMNDIESTVDELRKNFNLLIAECDESMEALTATMHKCRKEIKELRQTIDDHIKKIEKQILDELTCKFNQCLSVKEKLMEDLEKAAVRVKQTSNDLINMKNHASELQVFLGLRDIESFIKEDKCFIEHLLQTDTLKHSECKFDISPAIFYITSDLTLLGKLSIEEKPIILSLEVLKKKEAQAIRSPGYVMHQYSIKTHWQIHITGGKNAQRLTGCTMLPSGDIAIADKNNDRLLICDPHGYLKKEIAVIGSPVDVAYESQNQVAISLANKAKIKFVNTETGTTCHKLSIPSTSYGISTSIGYDPHHSDYKIVARIKDFGFLITDRAGKKSKVVENQGDAILYVSYKDEKLYFTKWDTNKVICCDLSGNIIWEFMNDILQKPCGISLADDGNMFVAGFESSNIVMISEDGKHSRELVTELDSLNNPAAIHFNSELNQLVVVNLNDGICNVFEINR